MDRKEKFEYVISAIVGLFCLFSLLIMRAGMFSPAMALASIVVLVDRSIDRKVVFFYGGFMRMCDALFKKTFLWIIHERNLDLFRIEWRRFDRSN